MSQKPEEILSSYGSEILSTNEAISVQSPELSLNCQQIIDIFSQLPNNTDSPLFIGFFNCLAAKINANAKDFTKEQIQTLQAKLLQLINQPIHEKAVCGFSDSCITVLNIVNKEWPQIIDYVFSNPTKELSGYLLVRLIGALGRSFVLKNENKVYPIISSLLPLCSISLKSSLITVIFSGNPDVAFTTQPTLLHNFWSAILTIYIEAPQRITFLEPLIEGIFHFAPKSLHQETDLIQSTLNKLTSVEQAKPLLNLIQYMSVDAITSIINFFVEHIDDPIKLSETLYKGKLSDISDDVFDSIAKTLKGNIDTLKGFATYIPFAAVSEDMSILEKVESKDEATACIAMTGLALMSNDNDDLEFEPPQEILNFVIYSLISDSKALRDAAYHTLGKLIKNDVIIDDENTILITHMYKKIKEEDTEKFFKLLRLILDVVDVDKEVVEKIFDFAYIKIRQSDKNADNFLRLFCEIDGVHNEDVVLYVVEDLFPIAINILNQPISYPSISAARSLLLFLHLNQKLIAPHIRNLVPLFYKTAQESTDIKIKGSFGVFFADAIVTLKISERFSEAVSMVEKYIQSDNTKLMKYASVMAGYLAKTQYGLQIFNYLYPIALKDTNPKTLNPILEALHTLNIYADGCDSMPLAESFMSLKHPIYGRKSIAMFNDRKTNIPLYLQSVAMRLPLETPRIVSVLIQWFDAAPRSMYSVYLDALNSLTVDKENAIRFVNLLNERIRGLSSALDEVMLGIIMKFIRKDQSLLDITAFCDKLVDFWKGFDDQNGWEASVGSAILELARMGMKVEYDVVEDIMSCYPFDPDYGKCAPLTESIIDMLESEKWTDLVPIVGQCFSDFLTLRITEYLKFDIDKHTAYEIKRVLKAILETNPPLTQKIMQEYQKNSEVRAKRFSIVLKNMGLPIPE